MNSNSIDPERAVQADIDVLAMLEQWEAEKDWEDGQDTNAMLDELRRLGGLS